LDHVRSAKKEEIDKRTDSYQKAEEFLNFQIKAQINLK